MVRFSLVLAVAATLSFTYAAQNDSELAPVTSMAAGSFHTVVIIEDSMLNVVKDWGANGKGQVKIRIPSYFPRRLVTQIGTKAHVRLAESHLKCSGFHSNLEASDTLRLYQPECWQ